jgi:hypothetical protein
MQPRHLQLGLMFLNVEYTCLTVAPKSLRIRIGALTYEPLVR